MDEIVDASQVAARTKLSTITLQKWRTAGKGPPYRKAGRRVLYVWGEVVAWLDARKVEGG